MLDAGHRTRWLWPAGTTCPVAEIGSSDGKVPGLSESMIEPESHERLRREIGERIRDDQGLLDALRAEIRPLRRQVQRIQARTTTSISLVGTDGGNNSASVRPIPCPARPCRRLEQQRVLPRSDHADDERSRAQRRAVSTDEASRRQRSASMMRFLGVDDLPRLTPHDPVRHGRCDQEVPSWVQVYRELVEWAVLFSILRKRTSAPTR